MRRSPATVADGIRHAQCRLEIETRGQGFIDITEETAGFVAETGGLVGVLVLLCRHTSASLTIQENADPDVRTDLATALDALAPRGFGWVHALEGPDDMPAHVRTMLTDTSLAIPVSGGRLMLGTWQAIYLVEHRDRSHRREVVLAFTGTTRHMT